MHFFYTKQCSVVWTACNNSKRRGCKGATFQERSWQRSDVPRTLLTTSVTLALTIKQIRTHLYFPFAFMWYIIRQKDPSKIFSVLSKTKIVDLTMKKVSCSTVLPGRAVKPLLRNIVYDDFTENSQAVATPTQDIFPE